MPAITIYSGKRVMHQVNLDKIRISRAESITGKGKRIAVDLFGSRVGENPKLGLAGDKASVVCFLRRLASQIESKE